MPSIDTLTNTKIKDTYTKLLQINDDNELLDGVGGQVAPVLKSGATITGSLNVQGTIYQNGSIIGGDTALWGQNNDNEVYSENNVGVGTTNPNGRLVVDSSHESEDFFIIKKTTISGDSSTSKEVFKITNEGTMKLGAQTEVPSTEIGGLYYNSNDDEFYLGYEE